MLKNQLQLQLDDKGCVLFQCNSFTVWDIARNDRHLLSRWRLYLLSVIESKRAFEKWWGQKVFMLLYRLIRQIVGCGVPWQRQRLSKTSSQLTVPGRASAATTSLQRITADDILTAGEHRYRQSNIIGLQFLFLLYYRGTHALHFIEKGEMTS